jgi:hypothetical protein
MHNVYPSGGDLAGEIEAERERATGPIVDYDLLMQLIGQCRPEHPRDRISRAAGGLRHDHADRVVGIFSRGLRCERTSNEEQKQLSAAHRARSKL